MTTEKTKIAPAAYPGCLDYIGALGHPWAVTYIDASGVEHVRGECNFGAQAAKWADEEKDGEPRIWQRIPKRRDGRRYKLVPHRAAVLDGDA